MYFYTDTSIKYEVMILSMENDSEFELLGFIFNYEYNHF
jgi:hypothetical protein